MRAVLPLVLLRLWWRGRREPGYRESVGERFGRYRSAAPERLIWVHAVSVGEARASAPLVEALRAAFRDHELLLTCTTAAGRDTLEQIHGERARIAFRGGVGKPPGAREVIAALAELA